MTAEADVLAELKKLRVRVPQLTGVLAASTDGLVLAADSTDAESVAALTAAALGVALRLTEATGQGASASYWSGANGDTSRPTRRAPRPSSPSWPSHASTWDGSTSRPAAPAPASASWSTAHSNDRRTPDP